MATLLYTNKLAYGSPRKTVSMKTVRFQSDSYAVRAKVGINPVDTTYDLSWVGLTGAEATALVAAFDAAAGVDLFQWTPPLSATALNFTVSTYSIQETPGPNVAYSVNATLKREFDL